MMKGKQFVFVTCVAAACTAILAAETPENPPPVDRTKRVLEVPVELLVAGGNDPIAEVAEANVPLDVRKKFIESPTENLIVESAGPNGDAGEGFEAVLRDVVRADRPFDVGKGKIEAAPELFLAVDTATDDTPARDETPRPAEFDNPKVAPGKVNWHASFEEACVASQDSGKPVLLFQMMGNLDDRFC